MEHTILTEYVYTLMCLPLGASGADCNSTFVIKKLWPGISLSPAWHKFAPSRWQKADSLSCPARGRRQVLRCCWSSPSPSSPWRRTTQHCLGGFNVEPWQSLPGNVEEKISNHRFSSWDKSPRARCKAPHRWHFEQSSRTAPEERIDTQHTYKHRVCNSSIEARWIFLKLVFLLWTLSLGCPLWRGCKPAIISC